jgi:sugar phosphate isomerase/epimerase
MKFAICNETFWEGDFAATCEAAARHGYTGLEVAPFTLGDVAGMTPPEARKIGNTIRASGLCPVGLHWLLAKTSGYHLTDPDPAVSARTFAYALQLANVCETIGGGILVWGSPQQRSLDPSWNRTEAEKRFIDFFQRLSPHLARSGVTVAFEFLGPKETNFINTAAETINLLREIDSPNVRLHLDVKAMAADIRPIPEIVRDSLPWTAHFHANDPNLLGPGMGEVDFPPIAAELAQGGYPGWVSVEVFDLTMGADTIAEQSFRNLQAAFQQV